MKNLDACQGTCNVWQCTNCPYKFVLVTAMREEIRCPRCDQKIEKEVPPGNGECLHLYGVPMGSGLTGIMRGVFSQKVKE